MQSMRPANGNPPRSSIAEVSAAASLAISIPGRSVNTSRSLLLLPPSSPHKLLYRRLILHCLQSSALSCHPADTMLTSRTPAHRPQISKSAHIDMPGAMHSMMPLLTAPHSLHIDLPCVCPYHFAIHSSRFPNGSSCGLASRAPTHVRQSPTARRVSMSLARARRLNA